MFHSGKGYWQVKLAALSMSPDPLYLAILGNGQSGRVRLPDQVGGTSGLDALTLARRWSGAVPFSTQFTSAVSASNWSVAGPPPQWFMPATEKKRTK
jgi:hypothetical protein